MMIVGRQRRISPFLTHNDQSERKSWHICSNLSRLNPEIQGPSPYLTHNDSLRAAAATAPESRVAKARYIERLDDVDRDALRELIARSVRVREGFRLDLYPERAAASAPRRR